MSRGRNYTVAERAVIAIGAAARRPVWEINTLLAEDAERAGGTFRKVNSTTLAMAHRYPSMSRESATALWAHILRPKSLSDAPAPAPATGDTAALAEERLAALLAAEAENTALRQQVGALTRLGVSLHKAEQAGADAERAAVAAWLRANTCGCYAFADAIERGDHRNLTAPAGKTDQGAP